MKPDVEERMNIQRIPWIPGDTMEMNDMYHNVAIVKEVKTPDRIIQEDIEDYQNLFEGTDHDKKKQRKRVLLKGNPGIGKSTLIAKMAYDWAISSWKRFALVFLVSLKVIHHDDPIENIIIDENITPSLYDENYKPQKLVDILKSQGEKCLIIFEGFDERVHNEHVMKIIQGKKFRKCNYLVTSRPDAVGDIEQYFTTICTVNGFTYEEAKKYIRKLLNNQRKVKSVMQFTERNQGIGIHEMWRYPIVLLFICVLVNDGKLNLNDRNVTLGDIYDNLLICLYRRYSIRKNMVLDEEHMKRTLSLLGKFALKMLEKGKTLFKSSEIEREVGKDAFQYGIIIGFKSRKIVEVLEADIEVCFLHETIQEFLAAKFIINELEKSNRRPEDIWPRVWDISTVSNLPLLLVFAIDLSKKSPDARHKLTMSARNILNIQSLKLEGNSVGASCIRFLTETMPLCNKLQNFTFLNTRLCDDEFMIPNLILNLPDSVEKVIFEKCSFFQDYKNPTGRLNPGESKKCKTTKQIHLHFIGFHIPTKSVKCLIMNHRYISLVCISMIQRQGLSQFKSGEFQKFYEALIDLISKPLPGLQHLEIGAIFPRDLDIPSTVSDEEISRTITEMHIKLNLSHLQEDKFKGNLNDLVSLVVKAWHFPAQLARLLIKYSLGNRRNLQKLTIMYMQDFNFTSYIEDLLSLPSPNLNELNSVHANHTDLDIVNDSFREILNRNPASAKQLSDLRRLRSTLHDYSSLDLTSAKTLQNNLPAIEKLGIMDYGITTSELKALMKAIHGSKTLQELRISNLWLRYFIPILKGYGLPALKTLTIKYFLQPDTLPVKHQPNRACTGKLPRLRSLDFSDFYNEFLIPKQILQQFFTAVRGSDQLTSVNLSGQRLSGCLGALLDPEGLPSLTYFAANGCGLQPGDIKQLGDAVQTGKLNKVITLSLAFNLDLSGSIGLLCKDWPMLETINLDCIPLTIDDVHYLVTSSRIRLLCLREIICDDVCSPLFEQHAEDMQRKCLRYSPHRTIEGIADMYGILKTISEQQHEQPIASATAITF